MARKTSPLPRVARLADNIRGVYAAATEQEILDGLAWYAEANTFAKSLATLNGTTVSHAAAVIAVLSPQVRWSRNKVLAHDAFSGQAKGLLTNVYKAHRLAGVVPFAPATADDVVSGSKVSCFYANILDPSGHEITIDRHAFDIAQGKRTNDKARGVLSNKDQYARYCQAYQIVATELGIGACQLQAITWVAWRRMHEVRD